MNLCQRHLLLISYRSHQPACSRVALAQLRPTPLGPIPWDKTTPEQANARGQHSGLCCAFEISSPLHKKR